jgi:hypothetical protein
MEQSTDHFGPGLFLGPFSGPSIAMRTYRLRPPILVFFLRKRQVLVPRGARANRLYSGPSGHRSCRASGPVRFTFVNTEADLSEAKRAVESGDRIQRY